MLVSVLPYLDLGDATPRSKGEVRDILILVPMSFTPYLLTLLNFVFGQSRLWKFLHGLVAVPVEIVRFERSIHLYDSNTSWVNLNIVSLYKPVSLSKIKVLCCLNVDGLFSRTLLLIS